MLIPLQDLVRKYNMHPKGVVHIGANTGQEAKDYLAAGIKHSFWIEAIPTLSEILDRNIKQLPFERSMVINGCMSDADGEQVTFNIANNEGQSSSMFEFGTHAKMHPTVKYIDKIKLGTTRFDTLMERLNSHNISASGFRIENYDFLNIDVQGAELKVLKGMGEYIKGFKWMYLEVNKAELYKGCPMVEEIDEYVGQYGFKRAETKWTNWQWGDALYIR